MRSPIQEATPANFTSTVTRLNSKFDHIDNQVNLSRGETE